MKKASVGGWANNHIATSAQKVKMNSQTGEFTFTDDGFEPRNMQNINFNPRVDGHNPKIGMPDGHNDDESPRLNREDNI